MSIKKLSNTIISEVYHQILKVECDELIDLDEYDENRITIGQLKNDIEVRKKIFLRFYHKTLFNLIKTHLGIDEEKPIIFYEDLEIIDEIKNHLSKLITEDEWYKHQQLIRLIDDRYYLGYSLNEISNYFNINVGIVKKYLKLSMLEYDIRIECIKEFYNRLFDKELKEISSKLKWGRDEFFKYYDSSDSYIIECLEDGRGIIYESIKPTKGEELNDDDFIIIPSDIMSELYDKVESHRIKLNDRIKSYSGWKIKERSFQLFRNKGVSELQNRIIRYMVVKEYDFNKWNLKLYSDLLHREIITVEELYGIQIHFNSPSYDFKTKIRDVIEEVLLKYDYREKPKVISVDTNKYFRIKNKYESILQLR